MEVIDLLGERPLLLAGVAFLFSLMVGSFLNVVVYRLPVMLQREWRAQCCEFLEIKNETPDPNEASAKFKVFNLSSPGSHCPNCNTAIKPWQNIPVLSYLLLGGKCGKCKQGISLRYPSVELATAVLSALVAYQFGATWLMLTLLLFTWSLVSLTLIDADHQLLPDNITIPLLWLGLLVNALGLGLDVSLNDAVVGAMSGYLVLWAFYWVFKLATGKEGMGYGDFKLLAALGAWLGWQSLLPIIILSSLVGAVYGIGSIALQGRDRATPMPFGPYLAGAGYLMLIWGEQINGFYYQNFVS